MMLFWLVSQFALLGGLDMFYENSIPPFLCDQSPLSRKRYLVYLNPGLSGLETIGGVLSVYVVGEISRRGGKKSWFEHDLSQSRWDRYYWGLAGLSAANFIWFILAAICFPFPYSEAVSSDTQAERTVNQDKNEDQSTNDEFINSLIKENEDIL